MAGTLQNEPELQHFLVPNVRPTGRQLGHGAYGSVEEVQIPGALCAAKKIHDILLRVGSPDEIRNVTAKFVEECQLMSSLRHPHIVQFLGICFLPGSRVPALVMEKLLTSVDDLLERNPNIPLSIKRGILHDVAQGLAYLHHQSPPLIHRDLTAKNVLLNSAMMAKLADLGVARIVDVQPGQLAATMTRAPGTLVYMPPEALEPRAKYDTKIDIFSLGNLAMYILTQIFPELLAPTYVDPQSKRLVARSEIERRIEYIRQIHQQLGREHPLLQMVEWCLENSPEDRPTIVQVLRQLEQARALIPDRFEEMNKLEMVQQLQLLQEPQQQLRSQEQQIRDLQAEVLAKEAENRLAVQALSEKERENQQLQVQLQSKVVEIRNLQEMQARVVESQENSQREIQKLQRQIRNLQAELQARGQRLDEIEREKRQLQVEVQSSSTQQDAQQAQLVTDLLSQVQQLQLEKEQLQKLHPQPSQMPRPSPPQMLQPSQMPRPSSGQQLSPTKRESVDERSIPQQKKREHQPPPLPEKFSQLNGRRATIGSPFGLTGISDYEADSLAGNLRVNKTLETLGFDNVTFSTNGLSTVLTAFRYNKSVKDLRLQLMTFSDTDSEVLAQVLRINTTIATLVFNNVRFSTNGLSTVLSALCENKSVKYLCLQFMTFSDTDSEVLAQVLRINTTIETLWLGGVNISDVGFTTLAEAMRDNQSLTTLDLYGIGISDGGANALASALQENNTLQTLRVEFKSVSDGGARDFAKKLQGWGSTLKTLVIYSTRNISGEVKDVLRETASRKGIHLSLL